MVPWRRRSPVARFFESVEAKHQIAPILLHWDGGLSLNSTDLSLNSTDKAAAVERILCDASLRLLMGGGGHRYLLSRHCQRTRAAIGQLSTKTRRRN
jgi:hypothetical protein